MIFRWLQGKSKEPSRGEVMARAFDLSLSELLKMLTDKVAQEEPAARTMVLVAFANVRSDLKANKSLGKSEGIDLPTTYAEFGRNVARLFDKYPPTNQGDLDIPTGAEIKFRRLWHFYQACILGAVSERAHATNAQLKELASLWCTYIESARYLQALLAHTLIWSKDETDWFGGCADEKSYIRSALYMSVPEFLWEHDEMLDMAKQHFGVGRWLLKR